MTDCSVLHDVLWVEKHRPTTLAQMALEPETRRLLEAYLAVKEIPHLLFVGPPGSGKTTVARIICQTLDATTLTLNASSERGIDTVRARIGTFATAMLGTALNIVFLDEADAMTPDAQTALRNLIESYADRTRFLLTANLGHRIIEPIRSRCQTVEFPRPPLAERFRIVNAVLVAEGITADPAIVLGYAERYPDLRQALLTAQRAYLATGTGQLPPAKAAGVDGAALLTAVLTGSWATLRTAASSDRFDPQQALRDLFWAVPDDQAWSGPLRHVFGKAVHESGYTPDAVVLFLAAVSEAIAVVQAARG